MAANALQIVNVIGQDGGLHGVPSQHLDDVLRSGEFRLASPDETAAYWKQQDYGGAGQGAAAFGEGALSAATFGLGPKIEEFFGATPEGIAGRKEVHPIAHGAGEVAGVLAPLALTGGAAAAPEAAGAAAEAAPGVLGAARTAARFTAPAIIGRAGEAAAGAARAAGLPGIAGIAAQGAVEGGLYGAADVAERHFLKDPALTAEGAAAEVGLSSLFGGALMGAGSVAAKGFSAVLGKASRGLQSVAERLSDGDPATIKLMMENRGTLTALEEASPGAVDQIHAASPATADFILKNAKEIAKREEEFPGLTKLLARADPDTGQVVLDNWGKLLKDPQRRIEVGTSLLDATQSTYSTVEGALGKFNREVRPEEAEALLSGPHTVELPGGASALEHVTPAEAEAEGARVANVLRDAIKTMRAEPDLFEPAYARELEQMRDGLVNTLGGKGEISGIVDTGRGPPMAEPAAIFQRLRTLRQQLDGNIPWDRQINGLAERKSVSLFKDLRESVRDSITGPVWGQAGERQGALDVAYRDYFAARKQMLAKLGEGTGTAKTISPTKVNAWVNAMADMRGKVKSDAFTEYAGAAKRLANEMETSGMEGAQEIRQQIDAAVERASDVRDRSAVTQIVKMLQGHEILSSGPAIPDVAGVLGREVMHRAGAKVLPFGLTSMLTGTIEHLRSPSTTIGVLNALDKLAQKTRQAVSSGVGRVFQGETAAASSDAARTVTTPEKFSNVAADLHHYGSDFDRLAETVAQHTSGIADHAPAAADALTSLAARGVHHLQSLLPQAPDPAPLSNAYRPSVAELVPFNRAQEIAQHPMRVLHHIARGTLDRVHVATAETIWPKLTAEMRTQLTEKLAEAKAGGRSVPRRSRLALSMFLGSDLDRSTMPAVIAAHQASFRNAPGGSSPQAMGGRGGGKASAMKSAGAFATAAQRAEGRDGRDS